MLMRIKFTREYTVQAHDGPTYREGQIEDMAERAALHFINRGAAVEIAVEEQPEPEPETPDEEQAPADADDAADAKKGRKDRFNGKGDKAAKRFKKGQDEFRKKELDKE